MVTGFYPIGRLEVGDVWSLVAFNPVEKFRLAFALQTTNDFSKRVKLGGRIAYGFGDERFKYEGTIRYNVTKKKRGMLSAYYSFDIEQIGSANNALSMGSTFATALTTAPFDKLTFVKKVGVNFEKDIKKDFVSFLGMEMRELSPLGLANYKKVTFADTSLISKIRTTEITAQIRWSKNEEFISGNFDRIPLKSKNPVFTLQGVFGVKGLLGGQYEYQKFDLQVTHHHQIGIFGRIFYGGSIGYVFGNVPYPLLKAIPGNQSLYSMKHAFNKLNFLEFVCDKYATAFIENKWGGLLFDRVPLVKKLKLRLVTTGKMAIGKISNRHEKEMLLPSFVKHFRGIPYVESSIGIENIFKMFRVDLVWRMTHLDSRTSPLGVRARFELNF
jgi:hypothetical protein